MSYVTVDAPKVDAANVPQTVVAATGAARLRPLPRPQRRDLERPRRRRGRALRLPLRRARSSRSGSSRCASSPAAAEQAYAFFNNNNQTNGVAQAPAGAELLRRLLEEHEVPIGVGVRAHARARGDPRADGAPELFGDVIRRGRARARSSGRSRRAGDPPDGFDAVARPRRAP